MVTVRGKQRNKRRGRISKTSYGKDRKKQHNKQHKVVIKNELIRTNWDKNKTIKENFTSLGLVSDPNAEYKTTHHKKKVTEMEVEFADISEYKKDTVVVQKLEEKAKEVTPTVRHFSPAECALWDGFIRDHGSDYKAMARDKRNTHQHTPKTLKRKIESYMKFTSSEYKTKMGCVG